MNVQLKPETEAAIRALAHQMWEDEGRPEGRDLIHWQLAYEAIVNVASVTPTTAPVAAKAKKQAVNKTPQSKAPPKTK